MSSRERANLDISIGTQSLMHPVDWLEVNARNGLSQQPLPEADETTWFETGNLSALRTPLNRKSYPQLLLAGGGEEDEDGCVVHTVATDIEFCIGMSMAEKHAVILRVLGSNSETGETPHLASEPVPFSTIKKQSSCGNNRCLARSKRSLFAGEVQRNSLDDSDTDSENHDDIENYAFK